MGVPGYEQGFKKVRVLPHRLAEPLQRTKGTLYFVNSMSDLFHKNVSDEFIEQVFAVMERADWHTFQVLTKRAERLAEFTAGRHIPAHVWLGVSVENKRHGVPRIAHLKRVPAVTRFLSVEPLLEDVGALDLSGIQWVIVGGESGHGARAMDPMWAENIRRQCHEQRVAFFFKQWGAYGADGVKRSKKANGRDLGGRVYDEMPVAASL